MQRDLLSALGRLYPAERLLSRPAQLAPYESDALTVFRARPLAVVLPETPEEVIATLRFCSQEKIPFVARGSGTSLSGGSLPLRDGIVIGLNRLNQILRLDPRQRFAVVQPGVINADISTAAAPHGLYYAPDPSSQSICTIGGNVAFNSGGAHCLKHGMTSNHVLGIKAVLPDGEVVELGGESLEEAGPDLTGLFVGSEGLFGIALEITVRLVPKPECLRTILAAYKSLEAAGEAVSRIVAAGFLPGAIEIMDRLAIKAAEAAVHAGYPEQAAALLIVELEGETDEVEVEFARLQEVIRASGAFETRIAHDDEDRARIWKGRKGAFSSVGRLSPDYIVQDGVVPRTRLGEALAEIERLGKRYGIEVANVFHAGDGNLHPLILFDATQEGVLEKAEELAGEIIELCIRLGGSITGEHGVGMEKRKYLAQMFNATDLSVMKRIRRSIDPLELSNRGKMFPPDAVESRGDPVGRPSGSTGADGTVRATHRVAPTNPYNTVRPTSIEEIQDVVRSASRLAIFGGCSKIRSSRLPDGLVRLDMSPLSGLCEYEPTEFTFTALAGTPVAEVQKHLAEHGQFLPFDPILVERGATLGGTVAAGCSGPERYRYGGIRDFLIGIRFITGNGELVKGGGRVVKNAAGFDLPKLMVGTLGSLGILTELTFKVFPRPESYGTLEVDYPQLEDALEGSRQCAESPIDLQCVELEPPGRLWLRVGGRERSLMKRLDRLRNLLGAGEIVRGVEEEAFWRATREFGWIPSDSALVKVPITPARIGELETRLRVTNANRRYSSAGNVAWVTWTENVGELESILNSLDLPGLILLGAPDRRRIGTHKGQPFAGRVRNALDPQGRFFEN